MIAMSHLEVHNLISDDLISNVKAENIKANWQKLVRAPYLPGTDANKEMAFTIAKMWSDVGLEDVHVVPYDVLLSHPDSAFPNKLTIDDLYGKTLYEAGRRLGEDGLKYNEHQWLPYSGNGRVSAEVVYCNRGLQEDFDNLKNMNVDLKEKIALIRLAANFRGEKIYRAQRLGAVGVIMFSDPSDLRREIAESNQIIASISARFHPDAIWALSERTSVMNGHGDPLTPLFPSKKELFRSRTIEQARRDGVLPKIPVMPVSYTTAYQILSRMKGRPAPQPWQGKENLKFKHFMPSGLMPVCRNSCPKGAMNFTYRVGPGFRSNERLTMDVRGSLIVKRIRNIIGYIRGKDEPDRYVMLGNHYDAKSHLSKDPRSGAAILAEVARAMMQTINGTGWRPARTIMFAAWDGEEQGAVGSTEFVEEFANVLSQRAIVYLNMDGLAGNTSLYVRSIPSLHHVIMAASIKIDNPSRSELSKGRPTLFHSWVKTFPSHIAGLPEIPVPGFESDHSAFLTYAGVPVVDLTVRNAVTHSAKAFLDSKKAPTPSSEDDSFAIHKAVGQFWAELARFFTDEVVLPFNTTELAVALVDNYLPALSETLTPLKYFHAAIKPAILQMGHITRASQELLKISIQFERSALFTRSAFSQNPFDSRHIAAVNERLMSVHRCFINPHGTPSTPQSRHVLYSANEYDREEERIMSSVYDAVHAFAKANTDRQRVTLGAAIAYQISIVQHSIHCATNTLKDVI
ncbi:unnamed protein product [Heligmosomoides polygyrus]|uniref:Peptidase_M28 domain-containing protein n=1 Tax=Heligmosomoides polygyrus TaxID=6339 RepID=A0A3P7Y1I2_HELPZ|nr:unnamed protein product [Heligmosomoides polygyrus]